MRVYFWLNEENKIDDVIIESGYNYSREVFPTDILIKNEDNTTSVLRKGFYGQDTKDRVCIHSINFYLREIQDRKKKGWAAYQIWGITKRALKQIEELTS